MIPGEIVCEDYEIIKKIGEGSFGYVYKVRHRNTRQFYALKTDEKSVTKMQLQNEVLVLKQIQECLSQQLPNQSNSQYGYIARCLDSYFSELSFNKMLMPLLGENIFNLFDKCNKRFDSHTIYEVVKAMLRNIEHVHSLGFIHRDIKPQNFVVGQVYEGKEKSGMDDDIYLVDFGLAKRYLQKEDKAHVPYEIGRKIRGTPMYMSVNVMLGIQPSRQDDLESLMYILVFLLKGRLPWHNLKITRKYFDQLIIAKISIQPDDLFESLPKQLKQAFIYIRKLKFQQTPNYTHILKLLESILNFKNLKIEEEYNGKYSNYCWQLMFEKETFSHVTQTRKEYMQKNLMQALDKEKQYSLMK